MSRDEPAAACRVVIVGAGFGGLRAARALQKERVEVLLLDRNNYHLFQPLLYQVATAGLTPSEISRPVRTIFRKAPRFDFRMVEVTGVNLPDRTVETDHEPVPYDALILAMGGRTNFFGLKGVETHGFGLKDIADAIRLRNHVLYCFEQAAIERDEMKKRALLTFVVVGGGPTGVEMAGALAELTRLVLAQDYPGIRPDGVRILLLEAGPGILGAMPPDLSEAALESLRAMRIEVLLETAVEDYDGRVARLAGGGPIDCETLIWAAGVQAEDLAGKLGSETARQGRVKIMPTLQLSEYPEVFVIGDAAYLEQDGLPLPMMAPVATQMGEAAAANVLRLLDGRDLEPFRYRDQGSLATIGRNAAVAHVRGMKFKGFPAWVVWLVVHIIQLIGFRNRLVVLINWAWDYFLYEKAVRMIGKD